MIHFTKCWTGRRWINLLRGMFAIGFGPNHFIERVYLGRRQVYP